MHCPKAIVFDLDDTLAESFQPPAQSVIDKLLRFLEIMPVAIITGRNLARIEPGLLPLLTPSPHISRFYLFPESASECVVWDGSVWTKKYGFTLTDDERGKIRAAIEESIAETHVLDGLPCFGERYVEKNAQTAYAMLGLEVPRDIKYSWDPGNVKRKTLQDAVQKKLPDFEVLMGGATSIDVTKNGVDKSYGVNWLKDELKMPLEDMLYVGDALFPGGNDFVVIKTGIPTHPVTGPSDTTIVMDAILKECGA